jgi:hypothetical protein
MDEVLVIGTAAGVLKVAEAITAARSRVQNLQAAPSKPALAGKDPSRGRRADGE